LKSRAAVLWEKGTQWDVIDIDLDPPGPHEVMVEIAASGMCHSQDHIRTGDLPWLFPVIGGHEGAGVVTDVGTEVTKVSIGDHIVLSFMPACGQCPSCATGHTYHCDRGAGMSEGMQVADGTARHHARDQDLRIECSIGTFANHSVVHEDSCIVIGNDIPLHVACLLGCSVATGWGAAVNTAKVTAGESVAVVGIGGIGANAVQGAVHAGARHVFAIDPVELKRAVAVELGATATYESLSAAAGPITEVTDGRMCDAVLMTIGVGDGSLMTAASSLTAKRGRIVVANLHPRHETSIELSLLDLTLMEHHLIGSVVGSTNLWHDVPMLLDLYRDGHLELDRLVTRTYSLDEVNQGYADMHAGMNIRGVLLMH
jgi:S-(hydroxymethyl)glutathione dehydrogenase/alcohol dehydrogenase